MITFITALYEEAKSIINTYKMKKRLDETFFQYFASPEAELIITGSGYSNAYKTVSRHFSLRNPSENDIVVNVGICGASSDYTVGELYYINRLTYINRINDCVFYRTYYPDLLYKNSFKQSFISSYSKVVTDSSELNGLVDMESGAIYDSLSSFFSPDRMFFFKVVSDITSEKTGFSNIDINIGSGGLGKWNALTGDITDLTQYIPDLIFYTIGTKQEAEPLTGKYYVRPGNSEDYNAVLSWLQSHPNQ